MIEIKEALSKKDLKKFIILKIVNSYLLAGHNDLIIKFL